MPFLQKLILLLISLLVIKAVALGSSGSEASVALALVGYQAFLTYIDWRKAKEVEQDFAKRVTDLEHKMGLLNLGRNFNK